MIKIYWDEGFTRNFKKFSKYHKDFKEKFFNRISLFEENPFHPILKTHKLSGRLSGSYAFSVDFKIRIIFDYADKESVILIDVGFHDDVY